MSHVMHHQQAAAPSRPPRTPATAAAPAGPAKPAPSVAAPSPAPQARSRAASVDRGQSARSDSRGSGHRVNGCFKKAPSQPTPFGRGPGPKPGGCPNGVPPRASSNGPGPASGGYPSTVVRSRSSGPGAGAAGVARSGSADQRGRTSSAGPPRASSVTPPARNAIADNRTAAAKAAPRRPSSQGSANEKPYTRDAGNVPKYLQKIRQAIHEEEQLVAERLGLNAVDDGAPPGCKLLPESERLETLAQLQQRQKELEAQHSRLPLKIETPGQRQRALEIDRELRTVEDGMKAFSRSKVFIRQ